MSHTISVNRNSNTAPAQTGQGAQGGPARQPQNVGVSAQAMRDDPMMVLIEAAYARSQATLDELGGLAEEQKQSNSQMEKIRNVEQRVREAINRGSISSDDLEYLRKMATEAGVLSAIQLPLDDLKGRIDANGEGHAWVNLTSQDPGQIEINRLVEGLREGLKEAKENVKGQSANRELDMQRLTQEYSTASQMASNLSKRQNDTAMAIIRNLA